MAFLLGLSGVLALLVGVQINVDILKKELYQGLLVVKTRELLGLKPVIYGKTKAIYHKHGDIIFFDWEGDGHSDHVGIVEKIENEKVYTIEGNTGNECKQREYNIKSSVIMGYGTPMYN